jgi:DNA invertase Pin-like site-specific DNA recombinase
MTEETKLTKGFKGLVYSYVRFSSAKQAEGTSLARQAEFAAKYCAQHGLTLDTSLSMTDAGLSAYHGTHIKSGALGVFLKAVELGRVAPGSVLLVEQLDRISRAEPILAQGILSQIIGAGIRVVTAADGREYSRETLKKDPMGLVYSLLILIRSHEESSAKSSRVKSAMIARCKEWQAGTWRKPIAPGVSDPGWVHRVGDSYQFIPAREEAMRAMISLYRSGWGALRIVQELDRRGLSIGGGANGVDRVAQLIRKRALVGERVLRVDGEEFVLQAYYPALLTEEEFAELQILAGERGRRPGRGTIPGIFTGMGLAFCGYCGSRLVSSTSHTKSPRDGTIKDGSRRLVCSASKNGQKCPVGGSCTIAPVENAIMQFCGDQINLTRLLQGDSGEKILLSELAHARADAAATQQQIDKLMVVLLDDANAAPATFAVKVRELESRLKVERAAVNRIEQELAVTASQAPATAGTWQALADGVASLDSDARIKVRQLVADSFSRILVYRLGYPSYGDFKGRIALELHGKRGAHHVIEIDRATGELIAREDIHNPILAQEYPRYLGRGLPTDPAFYDGIVSATRETRMNEDWFASLPEKIAKIKKQR